MHLPAICVSFMHSTFRVDQYMHGPVLFFTMYCIVHGFMGMRKGMWCDVLVDFLFRWSAHVLSYPSSVCNGESEYD